MSKASPFLSSSNAGEFSPRMDARVDFEKYVSGISRGLNLICLPQGGVTKRPGTRFIKEVKDSSAGAAVLIPFEPAATKSYQVEAGDFYFRFFRNQGCLTAATTTAAITNGTFTSGISGWTDRSTGGTAAISSSSGMMALAGAGNGSAIAEQAITIASSETATVHVIRFQLSGNSGSKATVLLGTSSGARNIVQSLSLGMGWHMVGFTPGATTVYLQFINEAADTLYVDNVSFLSNTPIELTSPYAIADVGQVRWAQEGDVMYLFHDTYATYKLERRGDTSWSLVKVFYQDGPWLGINPTTDLAAGNLLKNSRFDGGLSNWTQAVTGVGFVNYNSTASVVLFQASSDAAASAQIDQAVVTSAEGSVHVIHFQTIGGGQVNFRVGKTSGGNEILDHDLNAGWYSYSFTPSGLTSSTFYVSFSASPGKAAIAGGVSAAFCYNIKSRLLQPSGTSGSITVTALGDFKPFVLTDVGRLIRLEYPGREPGWGVITAFTDSQHVTVLLYRNLLSTEPLEAWRMGTWSDTTGWPHVGTFYQQRLIVARNTLSPQTIWGSQTADFENMRPDSWVQGAQAVQDDDGLNFTIASNLASPITWILGTRRLVVGTKSGQWAISSKGAAITPSDFSADPQTSVRALDIPPIHIDTVALFAQRAKRAVYDLGYSFAVDAFNASDITILADHITKPKIAQIVYQAEQFSNVQVRFEDGTMACLTYKRNQNVVGWTPTVMASSAAGAATVESISVIPGDDDPGQVYSSIIRDELWMIVRWTINGSTKRYIVVMEGVFDGPNPAEYTNRDTWRAAVRTAQADAFYVDCGLTYNGASTTTITGLDHLEGETVTVLADGSVQQSKQVVAGSITLDLAASKVHVGLPYDWTYRSLKLPYGSPTGPGVGQTKKPYTLVFVLRDAAAFSYAVDLLGDGDEVDGELDFKEVPFRRPADPMSGPVPLFSGEVLVNLDAGFNTDPRVVARGDSSPLPWTLLGVSPRLEEAEQ